jgi:hypothetical protein
MTQPATNLYLQTTRKTENSGTNKKKLVTSVKRTRQTSNTKRKEDTQNRTIPELTEYQGQKLPRTDSKVFTEKSIKQATKENNLYIDNKTHNGNDVECSKG